MWVVKQKSSKTKKERRKYNIMRRKNFTKQEVGVGNNIHHDLPIGLGGKSVLENLSIMNIILHRVLHRGIDDQIKGLDCCKKRNINFPRFGRKPSIQEQADKIADMFIKNTIKER